MYFRLKGDSSLKLGDVNTINITVLSGGVQPNVIPSDVSTGKYVSHTPMHLIKSATHTNHHNQT